ncbi:MAG: hypothetical protein ACOYOK_16015 [Pseudobdellovibrionaceae bacterium]
MKTMLTVTMIILLQVLSEKAFCKVDVKSTKPLVIPEYRSDLGGSNSFDLSQIVPTDMSPTTNGNQVALKIADRSLNTFWNSSLIKSTSVGRVAETVKEKVKADVVIQGSKKDDIQHKFSFRFETFQALAKVEYTGWLNAYVNYDAKLSETNFKLSERVFTNKDLYVQHTVSVANKDLSTMGVSWTW